MASSKGMAGQKDSSFEETPDAKLGARPFATSPTGDRCSEVKAPGRATVTGKQKFKIFLLKERSRKFCSEGNYIDALSILTQLSGNDHDQLETMFMTAECQLRRYQYDKDTSRDQLDKTVELIAKEMMTSDAPPGLTKVLEAVDVCLAKGNQIWSLILLHCACKFHIYKSDPHDKWNIFRKCLNKIDEINETVHKSDGLDRNFKEIFSHLMIQLAPGIEEGLASFRNGDQDAKVKVEVRFLGNKADSHRFLTDFGRARELYEEGLANLEQQFGRQTDGVRFYAEFLNNIGLVCSRNGAIDEAVMMYKKAIKAWDMAKDFDNEDERKRCKEISTNNLKQVLKKQEENEKTT